MPTWFQCKEDRCDQRIEYVPKAISGVIGFQVRKVVQTPSVVYLTCGNGHVHPYSVSSDGRGGDGG